MTELNIASLVENADFMVQVTPVYMNDETGDMMYLPTLDMTNIREIQIFNKMNEFVQTGHLIYDDDRQLLDKLLDKTVAYLEIQIQQNALGRGGEDITRIPDKSKSFSDRYLVDTVDIIDRNSDVVTYRLGLVDKNWINLTRNISYSSYADKSSVNTGEILQKLFKQAELKFAGSTLTGIGSSRRYITQTNDNLMTAYRYLMRRDFYDEKGRSDSLNILVQNTNRDEYGMYSVKQPDRDWLYDPRFKVANVADLSLFTQDQLETMVHKVENGLETLNLKGRTQVLDSFHNVTMNTFSQESGAIGTYRIETKDIVKFFGESGSVGYKDRYKHVKDILGETHFRDQSHWNNDINIYEDQVDNLLNFDSMVVVTDGSTNRIPGMDFTVLIRTPQLGTEQLKTAEGSKRQKENDRKYETLGGMWTISSVRHVLYPAQGVFRDTVCLFRNKNI